METAEPGLDTSPDPGRLELAPKLEEARQALVRLNDRALAFARERPATCILGAVALGFVVGKIAARY
jgi:hypothetical protein